MKEKKSKKSNRIKPNPHSLRRPKKNGKINYTLFSGSAGTYRIRAQNNQDPSPINGSDIWTSVWKTCAVYILQFHCNYFNSVRDQLWGLNMTWYWPYAVRPLNICVNKYRHAHLQSARSEKNENKCFCFPTETPVHCWLFERLWSAGARFRHYNVSPTSLNKKVTMSPSSTVRHV